MGWMQTIQGNALPHHIQLVLLQLRQGCTVGNMPQRNMHTLGLNQAQGLLKAPKLVGSVLLVIGVCRGKMREHTLNINAR